MTEEKLKRLDAIYSKRNLLEELRWGTYANFGGYTPKQSGEFMNWLCHKAYETIKDNNKAIPKETVKETINNILNCSLGKWYVGRTDGQADEVVLMDDVVRELEKLINN